MTEIRVVALSKPQHVAGVVAEQVRRRGRVVLRAAGAGAVHQAVKAVALAISVLAVEGVGVVCIPRLVEEAQGTAIYLAVEGGEVPAQGR